MCESTVSCPTARTSTQSTPLRFMVPPTTVSPARFVTGKLSPVIIDSSTVDAPRSTIPSVGTALPGGTCKAERPVKVNLVKQIPISKSLSKLATPVEIQLSSTGFASFDRVFSSGELFGLKVLCSY